MLRYDDESSKLNRNEKTWKLVAYAKGEKEMGFMSDTLALPVFPRKGTISPWSSKATSIAHICGLRAMLRELRGVLCFLWFSRRSLSLMGYLEERIMYCLIVGLR